MTLIILNRCLFITSAYSHALRGCKLQQQIVVLHSILCIAKVKSYRLILIRGTQPFVISPVDYAECNRNASTNSVQAVQAPPVVKQQELQFLSRSPKICPIHQDCKISSIMVFSVCFLNACASANACLCCRKFHREGWLPGAM